MAKRKRRNFTPEFKAEVVLETLSSESSQAEVCRRHNLSDEQLSKWKRQLLENAATLFEPADKQSDASAARSPLTVCVPGSIALKTLRSLDAIRSGWAILHTSVSKDTSSMYVCSWMSSLAGSEGGISVNT